MSKPDVLDWLAGQTTFTLATTNADGTPHACDLFFAHTDAFSLYFLSDPKTAHIRNLIRDPRASVTIHGASQGWQDIRGTQMVGLGQRVGNLAERAHGLGLYLSKFIFVRQWLPSVEVLGKTDPKFGVVELYKIVPQWVRWIDNTQGLGHKEEWTPSN
jgi:uncharacterized protein